MCFLRQEKNRLCGRVKRRCPIFPWGYPQSIIRAEELNDRVRDGNGCTLFAIITGSPAHTGGSLDTMYITTIMRACQYPIFWLGMRRIFASSVVGQAWLRLPSPFPECGCAATTILG